MKHFIIGTAGHVDHGKTALIKAISKIDCDTHKQEKERGITINLGFAHVDLPNGMSCGIVDMPGHKDFIDTMVAGASGIDLVLLVVAADSGVMPQTIEHINILNTLGVQKGIIVITKSDLVDNDFLELVNLEILETVENTCLEEAPIISVSSVNGKGISELVEKIAEISSQIEERNTASDFRMYPDRIFEVKGMGFVLTGSVLGGEIKIGDDVFLLPSKNKKYKVRGIHRHGTAVEKTIAGDRAAINLKGLKQEDFARGMILSNVELPESKIIDVQISVFSPDIELNRRSEVLFRSGTFQSRAKVHLLNSDKIKNKESFLAQISLEKISVLKNNDKFIVRNTSNDITIGGGTIFDITPLHHRKRTSKLLSHINQLSDAVINGTGIISLIKVELNKIGLPVFIDTLAEKLNVDVDEIVNCYNENENSEIEIYNSKPCPIIIHQKKDKYFADEILALLKAHHNKYFLLNEGINSNELITKLNLSKVKEGKSYLDLLIKKLLSKNEIKKTGTTIALFSFKVNPDKKTIENLSWLENTIEDYGIQKPIMADIETEARDLKIRKDNLFMMLKYFQNEKIIYLFEKDVLHASLVDKARKLIIEDLKKRPRGMNEGDFRKLIDGTKKIIHPLLGIFIREGIIERQINIIKITNKGLGIK